MVGQTGLFAQRKRLDRSDTRGVCLGGRFGVNQQSEYRLFSARLN
jgi:hypothetical protein